LTLGHTGGTVLRMSTSLKFSGAAAAAVALVACADPAPEAAPAAPAIPAAETAAPAGWVAAVSTGQGIASTRLQFEVPKAPRTGGFVAVKLRWSAPAGKAESRWQLAAEGALQRGAAPSSLRVPALQGTMVHEVTVQLRAESTGFGELILQPEDVSSGSGWSVPVWVAP
jgi:hypothetical protein